MKSAKALPLDMAPDGRMEGRTDGRTDGQRQNNIPPPMAGDYNT